MQETPFEIDDLVTRRESPTFVGRISRCKWESRKWRWIIRVKPIHNSERRNHKKARWCSARSWRRASPLELLSIQAGKD